MAEIGLQVAGQYGFALARGYAVQAHGILHRPSEDVDLFTAWERRADFVAAVGPVLHPDDVIASKMSALYTRAEPRDFLDVDAAITSGRYTTCDSKSPLR